MPLWLTLVLTSIGLVLVLLGFALIVRDAWTRVSSPQRGEISVLGVKIEVNQNVALVVLGVLVIGGTWFIEGLAGGDGDGDPQALRPSTSATSAAPPDPGTSTGTAEAPDAVVCELKVLLADGSLVSGDQDRCAGLVAEIRGGTSGSDYLTGGGTPAPKVRSNVGISHCRRGDVGSASLEYRENDEEELAEPPPNHGWIPVSQPTLDFDRDQPEIELFAVSSGSGSLGFLPAWNLNDDISAVLLEASGDVAGTILECYQESQASGLGDSVRFCWLACP